MYYTFSSARCNALTYTQHKHKQGIHSSTQKKKKKERKRKEKKKKKRKLISYCMNFLVARICCHRRRCCIIYEQIIYTSSLIAQAYAYPISHAERQENVRTTDRQTFFILHATKLRLHIFPNIRYGTSF
jgi:hypothetical protein